MASGKDNIISRPQSRIASCLQLLELSKEEHFCNAMFSAFSNIAPFLFQGCNFILDIFLTL